MTELATIELTTIELRPDTEQRYSVIWMHGLGADGHDFEAIVPELGLPEGHGIGFIFPNAPVQPVTINGGMEMRAWYDILDMSFQRKVDVEGIYQSSAAIDLLIKKELKRGIAAEHILLAGFSQGGAIALHTALTYPDRLAGVLALSTYLPTLEDIKSEFSQNNRALPIFMAHGTMDAVVDIQISKKSLSGHKSIGLPYQLARVPHATCGVSARD
jgi:Predicted esterase